MGSAAVVRFGFLTCGLFGADAAIINTLISKLLIKHNNLNNKYIFYSPIVDFACKRIIDLKKECSFG